jgi:hypothetical protein
VRRQELECEWVALVAVRGTYLSILGLVVDIRNALSRANVSFEMGLSKIHDVIRDNLQSFQLFIHTDGQRLDRLALKNRSAVFCLRIDTSHICQNENHTENVRFEVLTAVPSFRRNVAYCLHL